MGIGHDMSVLKEVTSSILNDAYWRPWVALNQVDMHTYASAYTLLNHIIDNDAWDCMSLSVSLIDLSLNHETFNSVAVVCNFFVFIFI